MSAMFFVGQGIQVPDEWLEQGAVNVATDLSGDPFDWSQVHGDLMNISSSPSEPPTSGVYAKVEYARYWFYVDILDIDSKETLTMLSVCVDAEGRRHSDRAPDTHAAGGRIGACASRIKSWG